MAYIKKSRARKELARDIPTISVTNYSADGGLRFNVTIGEHKVSFTHMEKDIIIAKWAEMQIEYEK